ncbi:MAG: response regulator [Bacteroidota bacterium]
MKEFNALKIFVVDDDPFYLNIFGQHLVNWGVEDISLFENGFKALDQLDESPDVIFLDHNMDHISGHEVLKRVKRRNPSIYVVMITARDNVKNLSTSLNYGAFQYIQKEKNEEREIREVLKKVVSMKRLMN